MIVNDIIDNTFDLLIGIGQGNLTTYLNKSIITKQNKLRHLGGFIWEYK